MVFFTSISLAICSYSFDMDYFPLIFRLVSSLSIGYLVIIMFSKPTTNSTFKCHQVKALHMRLLT